MATITISREYRSHGDTVAQLLCERLDYRYFDKNLMIGLAVQSGMSVNQVVKLPDDQQRARSLVERLFGNYAAQMGDPGVWAAVTASNAREQMEVSKVTHLIEAAYAQGNVVIIGRGGQAVLQGKPDVLHVRLIAPLELRIQRQQKRAGVPAEEARRQVIQQDKESADYVKRFYDLDPADPLYYDLIINTGKVTPSLAADLIIQSLAFLPLHR
jgi:cytidylate kinase